MSVADASSQGAGSSPDDDGEAAVLPDRFDAVPAEVRARVCGVEYIALSQPDGGMLYVTRHGWPWRGCLLPEQWYFDRQYARRGRKLPGGTGSVFQVATQAGRSRWLDLVVKFSRVAQTVPLAVAADGAGQQMLEEIRGARFNGPFEEFGRLMALRETTEGERLRRILTKRPLAIYSPAKRYAKWQMGRYDRRFHDEQRRLARDQEENGLAVRPTLDIRRDYILLFAYVKGRSIEDFYVSGDVAEEEFLSFAGEVEADLREKGFRVLDNKPPHFIVRRRRAQGDFLRRDGRIVYALVDFELLEPLHESERGVEVVEREAARGSGDED